MIICVHCEDPILADEKLINSVKYDVSAHKRPIHVECFIRMTFGSAAHQLRDCPCFGGDREEPEGLTRRQCATLALETFRAMNGMPVAMESYR